MRVKVGSVSHFGLAVRDTAVSADWWTSNFDLDELFQFEDGVCVANDFLMLMLFRGDPSPETFRHMAFNMPSLASLRAARDALRENGVSLEDPGDEIGPVGEGSASMGLWFRDPDGYRWEFYVEDTAED